MPLRNPGKINSSRWKKIYARAAIFFSVVAPVLLTSIFGYVRTRKDLTEYTFARRQAIARIAAIALKEKLDRLSDLGISLATRVRFRALVGQKNWEEAIAIMRDVPARFPIIERIIIADVEGIVRTDTPAHPSVRAKDFSFRDWYRGVTRGGGLPYVSEVYQSSIEPHYNVIAVATPIHGEGRQVAGILMLQVRVDRLFEWARTIEVGPSGFVYFVDKNGNFAWNPHIPPESGIVNDLGSPVVRRALRGEGGVEVSYDSREKEERVVAFEQVPGYGWGVFAQQPAVVAFAPQASNLRFLLITYAAIFLISGSLALLLIQSISRRERLAEEQAARIEAEKGVYLRDEFISIASHELKTPLTALRMQLQIVPKVLPKVFNDAEHSGKDFLAVFQLSQRQLERFSRLVDDLLDVSRIGAGRLALEVNDANLAEIVARALEQYRTELKESGCAVSVELDQSVHGRWDPVRIEQVVVNLLTNAMKYGAGKPIEITVSAEGGNAKLVIRDHGIGIAQENQQRIFERFERVVPMTGYRGLGLGLFITREIVKAHGGTICVESEAGKGAAFTVLLPL